MLKRLKIVPLQGIFRISSKRVSGLKKALKNKSFTKNKGSNTPLHLIQVPICKYTHLVSFH